VITVSNLFKNPALQRGWRTFFQAFVALYAVLLIPFLTDVINWGTGGEDVVFPDVSVVAKAGVASLAAGLVALVSYVQNAVEDKTGKTAPTLGK
jgi:hypothetical protein